MSFPRPPGGRLDFLKSMPWGDQDRGQRMLPIGITTVDASGSGNPRTYTIPEAMVIPGGTILCYAFSWEDIPTVVSGLNAQWLRLGTARSAVSSFAAVGLFLGLLPRNIPASRTMTVTFNSITTGGVVWIALASRRVPVSLAADGKNSTGAAITPAVGATSGARLGICAILDRSSVPAEPAGWKTELAISSTGNHRVISRIMLPGESASAAWGAGGERASVLAVLG